MLRAAACLATAPAQTPPGALGKIWIRAGGGRVGLTVLVRAHKRAVADGGELRLVIAAGGAVARIFAITRLDLVIPLFNSLDEALAPQPDAVIRVECATCGYLMLFNSEKYRTAGEKILVLEAGR